MLVAIDPGTEISALLVFHDDEIIGARPWKAAILENEHVVTELATMDRNAGDLLAVEMIASYGMPVGAEVFGTCVWIGRFVQAWGGDHRLVYRAEVKSKLCRSTRAKDANVRQALLDLYGGKVKAVGTKKAQGPLYGLKSHLWSALGVAVTAGVQGDAR